MKRRTRRQQLKRELSLTTEEKSMLDSTVGLLQNDQAFQELIERIRQSIAESREIAARSRHRAMRTRELAGSGAPRVARGGPPPGQTLEAIVAESKQMLTSCPTEHIHDVFNEALAIHYLAKEQARGVQIDLNDALNCLERMRAVFRERGFSDQSHGSAANALN